MQGGTDGGTFRPNDDRNERGLSDVRGGRHGGPDVISKRIRRAGVDVCVQPDGGPPCSFHVVSAGG
ncbi:hypothetical protein P4S83_08790 [Aneurinibacillus thermoaerophilus]|uniref:hypothetical protein n=1 Tax=Aneurinibacillus thermoaerophilus TaxID=143495 RepID=UPI002E1B7C6F|nr:hypothetical protein [Aneurinibacillus thermoaerophilus]MED0763768.1 hypothetical protein [Aneurinibacillus thermoaerophilus]